MKYYSAKQFSDMVGIPYSSLRYFERIGLIKPRQNSDNNYRTYTPNDAFLVNRFKFFRSLDFEAKEAIELAGINEQEELLRQIQNKEDELKEQVVMVQEKLKFIENFKCNVELMSFEEDYQIVTRKDKLFLPASDGNDFTIAEFSKLSKWVALLPLTVYYKRIKKEYFIANNEIKRDHGIAIDVELSHFLPEDAFSESVELIKGGKCIRFCTSKQLYPVIDPMIVVNATKYAKAQNLNIIGDISLEGLTTLNQDRSRNQMVFIPVD